MAIDTLSLLMFAARHKSTASDDPIVSLILFACFATIGLAMLLFRLRDEKRAQKESEKRQSRNLELYQKWRKRVDANGVGPVPVEIRLEKDESCYLKAGAILCEPRAIRQSVHTGGAVRVMKGVSIGRAYSTSESHEEWRRIASGCLYVTNKRILFDGDMQNRTVKMKDVVSVQRGNDYVAISSDRRQKTMVFCGINGLIANDIINSLLEDED
jgi:hypothetical protein